jgi:RND family efflux transporter MFP subunit
MINFLNYSRMISWYKKPFFIVPIAVALLGSGMLYAAQAVVQQLGKTENAEVVVAPKQIKTMRLGVDGNGIAAIQTVGTVKAENEAEVATQAGGTVKNIYFKIGDTVSAGQILVSLYDSTLAATLNNAQVSVNNLQLSYNSNQLSLQESIRQAELGVQRAQESVESAEIGLQAAKDNLVNGQNLQEKGKEDLKNTALTAYYYYLNIISGALDQTNNLLGADENAMQLPGLNSTIGVENAQTLTDAKNKYLSVRSAYEKQNQAQAGTDTITEDSQAVSLILFQTKELIDMAIAVLNNTTSSSLFPDTSLVAQRNAFTSLRTAVINAQTAAQGTLSSLQNIDLSNKRDLDSLQHATDIASNQLTLSKTAYETAVAGLKSAQAIEKQTLVSSKAAIDNARGQLNVIQTQAANLSVTAPIGGQITQKSVALGSEVKVGQTVAVISQVGGVKILASVSSEDIYKLKVGENVIITDSLTGVLTRVDPSADQLTKKVGIEIAYDNQERKLVHETFVPLTIPVRDETKNDSFFLPLSAVSITANENYVFLAKDGKAVKNIVELGATEGEKIEIKSGLKNGDEVIIEGNRDLENGQSVQIMNDKN